MRQDVHLISQLPSTDSNEAEDSHVWQTYSGSLNRPRVSHITQANLPTKFSLYRQQRLIIDEVLDENKKRGRPRNKKILKRGAQNNEESRLKKQR